jgi:hypothetical protein
VTPSPTTTLPLLPAAGYEAPDSEIERSGKSIGQLVEGEL